MNENPKNYIKKRKVNEPTGIINFKIFEDNFFNEKSASSQRKKTYYFSLLLSFLYIVCPGDNDGQNI